jgi:hypothetical protein
VCGDLLATASLEKALSHKSLFSIIHLLSSYTFAQVRELLFVEVLHAPSLLIGYLGAERPRLSVASRVVDERLSERDLRLVIL